MNIKKLKKVVKELTGLKLITFNDIRRNYECDFTGEYGTSVTVSKNDNKIKHIFLNLQEIRDMAKENIRRGFGIKNIYLKVILHEIAHVRQIEKCENVYVYDTKYQSATNYYEHMADRYARLFYKKVLLALDKG